MNILRCVEDRSGHLADLVDRCSDCAGTKYENDNRDPAFAHHNNVLDRVIAVEILVSV